MTGTAPNQMDRGIALPITFGIGGEHDPTERELPHLSGCRAIRPVRIGNGAWNQRQIDLHGQLLVSVYLLCEQLKTLDSTPKNFWPMGPRPLPLR